MAAPLAGIRKSPNCSLMFGEKKKERFPFNNNGTVNTSFWIEHIFLFMPVLFFFLARNSDPYNYSLIVQLATQFGINRSAFNQSDASVY